MICKGIINRVAVWQRLVVSRAMSTTAGQNKQSVMDVPNLSKDVSFVKRKKHEIDLRSDTVTRPSQRMKDVMMKCALGDDVFGDDPTVIYMQKCMAEFFGKEAALYMPSGTQSNLIAMMLSCKRKG